MTTIPSLPLSAEQLDKLEELMNTATAGNWSSGYADGVCGTRAAAGVAWDLTDTKAIPVSVDGEVVAWIAGFEPSAAELWKMQRDADFIAAAKNALPSLIAQARTGTQYQPAQQADTRIARAIVLGEAARYVDDLQADDQILTFNVIADGIRALAGEEAAHAAYPAQQATGATGELLSELDWCIKDGCSGDRTRAALTAARAVIAQQATASRGEPSDEVSAYEQWAEDFIVEKRRGPTNLEAWQARASHGELSEVSDLRAQLAIKTKEADDWAERWIKDRKVALAARASHGAQAPDDELPLLPGVIAEMVEKDPSHVTNIEAGDLATMLENYARAALANRASSAKADRESAADADGQGGDAVDEEGELAAATDRRFPMPNSLHASVMQRAIERRGAYEFGWSDRAALSRLDWQQGYADALDLHEQRVSSAKAEYVRAGSFFYDGGTWVATRSDEPGATILYRPAATPASDTRAAVLDEAEGARMRDVVADLREYAGNPGYSHNDYADTMRAAAHCIEALRARLWSHDHLAAPTAAIAEADAKDAARYRWLRNPDTDVSLVLDKVTGFVPPVEGMPGVGGYHTYEYRAGNELDAAIDAAMSATQQAQNSAVKGGEE